MRNSVPNCEVLAFFSGLDLGWSGGAMVLGKLSVSGRPTIGLQ